MEGDDGGQGADGVVGRGGGGAHRGEGRRRGGRREEEATGSERGEHVDVHRHSLPPHSALVVRDGDVERGDERVAGDSECEVEGGQGGMHDEGGEGLASRGPMTGVVFY